MKIPLTKILDIANNIANPKQGAKYALDLLSRKNPQAAETIRKLIMTGKNPTTALKEFATNGQVRKEDLEEIKGIYTLMKKVGFKKFDVPESFWNEVNECFNNQNSTNNWF